MLKFAQVVDQRPRGFGLGVQSHGKHLFHQRTGKHDIGIATSHIHKMRAQGRKQKVEQVDDADAAGQHPQCFYGIVGNHAVIDIHDKQRAAHGNKIDDHAGQGHVPVNGRVIAQHIPEPALAAGNAEAFGTVIRCGFHCGKERIAGVFVRQRFNGHQLGTFAGFGKNHLGHVAVKGGEHARTVVGEQQNARQHKAWNICDIRTIGDTPGKPRLAGRPQAGLRRYLAARKPGHEHMRRHCPPAQAQQDRKATQQAGHKIHV